MTWYLEHTSSPYYLESYPHDGGTLFGVRLPKLAPGYSCTIDLEASQFVVYRGTHKEVAVDIPPAAFRGVPNALRTALAKVMLVAG